MHCNPYSQLVSTKVEGLSLQLTPLHHQCSAPWVYSTGVYSPDEILKGGL